MSASDNIVIICGPGPRLSSEMLCLARAIAHGDLLIRRDPEPAVFQIKDADLRGFELPQVQLIEQPKEPWRRGRPLR